MGWARLFGMMKWRSLQVLLMGLWILWPAVVSAEARVGIGEIETRDALEESLNLWSAMSSSERGQMARLYARLDYTPGLVALRECASGADTGARDCLLALSLMDDLDSVVLFRRVLRESQDPARIEVAALTLGRWGDRLSYSLLNKALLEGRGGDWGGVALLRALLAIPRGPWREIYVEFARRRAPSGAVKLMAAAVLAPRSGGAAVADDLFGALDSLLKRDVWWPEHRFLARVAVWGATRMRGGGACGRVVASLRAAIEGHPEGRARVAAIWTAIEARCARRGGLAIKRAGVVLPSGRSGPMWLDKRDLPVPSVPGSDCSQVRSWLTHLSLRGELWDARGMPLAFARIATDTLCSSKAESEGWGASMLFEVAPKRTVKLKAPLDSQTRKINEPAGLYPASFDVFDPPIEQPEWFPEYIEVTIDDGPQLGLHRRVRPVLDKFGVRVTWFLCGVNILRQYNRHEGWTVETMQGLIDSGDHVAYHTMNHTTRRSEHVMNMTPEQLGDDVELFELVVKLVADRDIDLIYGRMPGGLGTFRAESRRAYYGAGMGAPVFWNAGPPGWPARAGPSRARMHACTFRREKVPIILLLHETAGLENELRAFFNALKSGCRR